MTEDTDKEEAARKVNRAADDLDDAAELLEHPGQARHVSDLADEANKTGDVLEDQAATERDAS